MFQYVKIYWIVLLLSALWWRTRGHVYSMWMLLYAYLLCDDVFQIHERGGGAIAKLWNYENTFGIRAQDLGELTVSGAVGFMFLVLILIMCFPSTRNARTASQDLAILLGVLAFFGVVIDMLHMAVGYGYGKIVFEGLGVVEDGGEMLVMSIVCWYVLDLLIRRGNLPASIWQRAKSLSYHSQGSRC